MPIWLGPSYFPNYSGYPAHMSREDYTIWQILQKKLTGGAIAIYFDVGLGGAKNIPDEYEPSFKYMWERLNQKRIDVLTDTGDGWDIIEIRPRATSTAIGRLLQYQTMWKEQPIDERPVRLILATDIPDPDVISLASQLKIEIVTP